MSETHGEAGRVPQKTVEAIRESSPRILATVCMAVLIWLFARLVFMPLALKYSLMGVPLQQLISIAAMLVLAALWAGVLKPVLNLADAAAEYLVHELGARSHGSAEEELGSCRTAFRGVTHVVMATALFLLVKDFLDVLHPAISAALLLLMAVWSIAVLIKVGDSLSGLVERYMRELTEKLKENLKGGYTNDGATNARQASTI